MERFILKKMQVCIVITTYKRNNLLVKLVSSIRTEITRYSGENNYSIFICDSDKNNPLNLEQYNILHKKTHSKTFDENLLDFFNNESKNYDYLYFLADDDILVEKNPLEIIDRAINLGKNAILFNHRAFHRYEKNIFIGDEFYSGYVNYIHELSVLEGISCFLPRYCGIMYSKQIIAENLEALSKFNGTLHLYVAPMFIAAVQKSAVFFNESTSCYDSSEKKDGAWECIDKIIDGLKRFQIVIKSFIDEENMRKMDYFFNKLYFCEDSELMKIKNRSSKSIKETKKTIRSFKIPYLDIKFSLEYPAILVK